MKECQLNVLGVNLERKIISKKCTQREVRTPPLKKCRVTKGDIEGFAGGCGNRM